MQKLAELGRFAGLYADRVYIQNFFADHLPGSHAVRGDSDDEARRAFYDDLVLIGAIRPLVEAGLVVPVTPSDEYCPHCIAKFALGAKGDRHIDREFRRLRKRYLDETQVNVSMRDAGLDYIVEGPDYLLNHGTQLIAGSSIPTVVRGHKRLFARLQAGEQVRLSKTLTQRLNVHSRLAGWAFDDILFELALAYGLGTSFLSDQSPQLEILGRLSNDRLVAERNSILQRYLTTIVPFVPDVPLKDLITLRNREADSFILFRQSLTQAVDAVRADGAFTAHHARQLYSDVVSPSLARLDSRVSKAKLDLVRDTGSKALTWSAALGIGLLSGLVPHGLEAAAQAIGATKVLADLAQGALQGAQIPKDVREDKAYFLWKVRKLAVR